MSMNYKLCLGVTAVIFVAAISEYDQKLFEDASTNRMVRARKYIGFAIFLFSVDEFFY